MINESIKSKKTNDITGNRYGRLVVKYKEQYRDSNGKAQINWHCVCDCGNTTYSKYSSLNSGRIVSCGCFHKENHTKHGKCLSSEYKIWRGICDRCLNPNSQAWSRYGGRGITICDRWRESSPQGFLNFLEDMGEKPTGLSIDRINNSLGYSKENCRWTNSSMQGFNTRKSSNNSSGRTGVFLIKSTGKWNAKIKVKYKYIHLGNFTEFEDAVKARETAELKYYGFIKK